jgi:hypothetical protein
VLEPSPRLCNMGSDPGNCETWPTQPSIFVCGLWECVRKGRENVPPPPKKTLGIRGDFGLLLGQRRL